MLLYYGPTGAPVENPGEEWVKEIFFHKGEDYWKQGNGESSIEVDEDWETESLVFFYHEPYGFFLMRYPDFLVPFKKEEKIETIKHVVAGAPLYVPSCSYVDRHQAYEIVQHFLKTKSVPDSVEWVELRTIDFQQGL
ncbi:MULTISPECIES: Imm1 family immunity protein [Bacillus]|uniref:Imm1 family immunity protein n=1 Tax=Bacillus TaxID=1386 RepID=UPI0011E8648A|nr:MULTISPECIES: Imm1 family immunity protein [Bacillus]MCA0162737.1 hypothetical protein [Bacillus sp. RAR_M1_44]TYO52801.1 hypothetical protein FXF70_07460 [Bacillus sp. Y3]